MITKLKLSFKSCLLFQILSSVAAFSIVIQVGINMAYSGVLIPQLANDANIKDFTKDQASWIGKSSVLFLERFHPSSGACLSYLFQTFLFSNCTSLVN